MSLRQAVRGSNHTSVARLPNDAQRENSMKVVSSIGALKYRHPDCQVVKRRGRVYVICKSNPKFKVRQGGAKVKKARR